MSRVSAAPVFPWMAITQGQNGSRRIFIFAALSILAGSFAGSVPIHMAAPSGTWSEGVCVVRGWTNAHRAWLYFGIGQPPSSDQDFMGQISMADPFIFGYPALPGFCASIFRTQIAFSALDMGSVDCTPGPIHFFPVNG